MSAPQPLFQVGGSTVESAAGPEHPQSWEEKMARLQERKLPATRQLQVVIGDEPVDLVLTELSRAAFEDLQAEHPPTAAQLELEQTYDVETFAPALVAACAGPEMSVQDAHGLLLALSEDEAGLVFALAVDVCQTRRLQEVEG